MANRLWLTAVFLQFSNHTVHRLINPFVYVTLPQRDYLPPIRLKSLIVGAVISDILLKLVKLEFRFGFRRRRILAIGVSVLETAVYENHSMIFGQNHVGLSRKPLVVFSESEPFREQIFSDLDFNGGVSALDAGHIPAPFFRRQTICHIITTTVRYQPRHGMPGWNPVSFETYS